MSRTPTQGPPSLLMALETYKEALRTVVYLQEQRQRVTEQAVVLSDALIKAEDTMLRARAALDEAIKRSL
jgi:hypothetical protein